MSEQSKLAILKAISEDAVPGKVERFSFNTLGKNLGLPKSQVDTFLTELNKEKYVAQYAKKGVDSFTVEIKQKGLDAIEDGNFVN
jgi:DNA-binding IclR family transcriptional regulator